MRGTLQQEDPVPERSLWRRLRDRERAACEAFVDAHYQGVHSFFQWLTNSREAAADLTQETFAAFWESTNRPAGVEPEDVKAWLYGIARNRWRKRCRGARTSIHDHATALELALEQADRAPGPEHRVLSEWETTRVMEAVAALPPDYREALALRVFRDLTGAQAAAALGISEGLVRWRVHQARVLLRASLEGTRSRNGANEKEETGVVRA